MTDLSSLAAGLTGSEILKIAGQIRELAATGREICNLTVGDFSPKEFRIPPELEVCATCNEGEVMAVRHRELPIDGVQFHPESVLTPHGRDLARNFLAT